MKKESVRAGYALEGMMLLSAAAGGGGLVSAAGVGRCSSNTQALEYFPALASEWWPPTPAATLAPICNARLFAAKYTSRDEPALATRLPSAPRRPAPGHHTACAACDACAACAGGVHHAGPLPSTRSCPWCALVPMMPWCPGAVSNK